MLRTAYGRFSGVCLLLLIISCNKDKSTGWDADVLVPLAEATLTIADILADSLLETVPGEPLILRYNRELSLIPSDSLFKIPDTTLRQVYSIPIDFTFPAGFQLQNINDEVHFKYKDVRITEADLLEGHAQVIVTSSIPDKLYCTYSIPKAFLDGQPFTVTNREIAPGSPGQPSEVEIHTDFSNYHTDLRGDNGDRFNRLRIQFGARLNPAGTGATVEPNVPLITYTNRFTGLRPYHVKGYLGSSEFSSADTVSLLFMNRLKGHIRLKDIRMDIELRNGVGADLAFLVDALRGRRSETGESVALSHTLIGNYQSISRALKTGNGTEPFTESHKTYTLTGSNSNLKTFAELLPDVLEYSLKVRINPLGDISSGNDFLYHTSNIRVKVALELPLAFSANGFSFTDTLETTGISAEITRPVRDGELRILADNGFPFEMSIHTYLLDENRNCIDSLFTSDKIAAAPVNEEAQVSSQQRSVLRLPVTGALKEHLASARYIVLKAKLDTRPGQVILPVYPWYRLRLQLVGNGAYRVQLK